MHDLQWDQEFEPEATEHELDQIEEQLGIKIPVILRKYWSSYSSVPPQRDGEDACYVVSKNHANGSFELTAIFLGFCPPSTYHPTLDWLLDKYSIKVSKVIPFALNGSSPIFLNYENDPTNSNPEIWNSDMEGFTLDESWQCIAPDIETLFSRLKTKKEALKLGIKL